MAKKKRSKKKKYNPFKMWGSYAGLLLGLTINCGVLGIFRRTCYYGTGLFPLSSTFMVIIFAIGGFLLGWGIHSWIRKVRK